MSQLLPYDQTEKWKGQTVCSGDKLKEGLNAPDDIDTGYFLEDDLKYLNIIKKKTKNFTFSPGNKFSPQNKLSD